MAHPSPRLVELARRIIEQEARGSPEPAASAAAVETACGMLKGHLVDLLGSGGITALLRRALHLAKRQEPSLAKVAASGESAGCFTGLTESLASSTDEEARAAAATLLTNMLDLLVMLLGEELGMKPIRKLWPRATSAREIDE
jgi:hypothetical protein